MESQVELTSRRVHVTLLGLETEVEPGNLKTEVEPLELRRKAELGENGAESVGRMMSGQGRASGMREPGEAIRMMVSDGAEGEKS